MTAPVDFTACPRVPGRAYNGANMLLDPAAFACLVAETPYLTDLQREFYTTYFDARAARLFGVFLDLGRRDDRTTRRQETPSTSSTPSTSNFTLSALNPAPLPVPRKPEQPNLPAPTAPNEIIVYRPDDSICLDVTTDGETMWLTQSQMAELFGCTVRNIRLHLENIYACGELEPEPTRKDFFLVRMEGRRKVSRTVACYNLDAIISVGYRVNSIRGVRFRQWATRVLREMLLNKLDEIKRIGALERRMDAAEGDIKQVQAGVNYLVQQLTAPPPDPPRPKICFTQARR